MALRCATATNLAMILRQSLNDAAIGIWWDWPGAFAATRLLSAFSLESCAPICDYSRRFCYSRCGRFSRPRARPRRAMKVDP